jgi:hypothetical protein
MCRRLSVRRRWRCLVTEPHIDGRDVEASWRQRLVARVARLERSQARRQVLAAGRNRVDNAHHLMHQFGFGPFAISGAAGTAYGLSDRWAHVFDSMGACNQTIQPVLFDAEIGVVNSVRYTCTTADAAPAAADRMVHFQRIEGYSMADGSWGGAEARPVTLQFWTNSNAAGSLVAEVQVTDGVTVNTINKVFAYPIGWALHTWTIPGNTVVTPAFGITRGGTVLFWTAAGSNWTSGPLQTTWGAVVDANRAAGVGNSQGAVGRYIEFGPVQLEPGSAPTPIEWIPVEQLVQRCMRFYAWRFAQITVNASSAPTWPNAGMWLPVPVPMRIAPTMTVEFAAGLSSGVAWFNQRPTGARFTASGGSGTTDYQVTADARL